MSDKINDLLESREFYELMQDYRHAPVAPQSEVVAKFEAVKKFLQDELDAVVGASPPPQPELQLRGLLQDFTARQRALIEARGKGGQHTGQSPSITPSVLRELEWMLRNSGGSRI